MILATTIFMTARIALDGVPDAFAFFLSDKQFGRGS